MLFNSWAFIPFIIPVLVLYYVLPFRWQNRMLLVASCIFYGAWDWRFLFLLVFSTSIDYFVGIKMYESADAGRRKFLLTLSIVANLGILCFFKYFNFFIDNAVGLGHAFGLNLSAAHLGIILPVGISFYTFHAMSYTIDIYRGKMTPIRSFPDYMLFVLYFPQLVAGPIARAADLIPQVTHPRTIRTNQVCEGLWLVLWGFFKKMVIADNLGPLVDGVFDAKGAVTGLQCLLATYAFAYQIYCDFSGYTDIARGLGKLMGFELALNFNQPYLAQNPAEFWHRWHISLSTWLRDYLYIPLGGNRKGTVRTYVNLILTMLLGGLWHGAAWNFIIWGLYHGTLLAVHRLVTGGKVRTEEEMARTPITNWLCRIVMFHLVCLGWLFFRARSFAQIVTFLQRMATDLVLERQAAAFLFPLLLLVGFLWVLELWVRNADDARTRWGWKWGLGPVTVSVLAAAIIFLTPSGVRQFLYFQF
jgi:D-alanyl-lipoteichoic acid acyltransferase DltB (MBOAT superfamily)